MADFPDRGDGNYFDPIANNDQLPATPAPAPGANPQSNTLQEWRDFLSGPQGRAALIQTGIALLQPRGVGDTAVGQASRAIGEGGQAAERVDTNEEKKLDQQSQRDYRKTMGESAAGKADAAMLNANTRSLIGADGKPVSATARFQADMQQQAAFRKWVEMPDNILTPSPVLQAMGLKSKGDLNTPELRNRAFQLWKTIDSASGGGSSPVPAPTLDGLPGTPTGIRPAGPGVAKGVTDREGIDAGLYSDPIISDARLAIGKRPDMRDRIVERTKSLLQQKGHSPREIQGMLGELD